MVFIKALILFSSLVVLANGAHIYLEQKETQELRTRRDTSAETAIEAFESKVSDTEEATQISEANASEDSKRVDDGEEKDLGKILNPFKIISSAFDKKPENGINNQQPSNKPGANYGSGNPQNLYPQNPYFNGHAQFANPPFFVPIDHFNGNEKPVVFHLTDSNNFYNGPSLMPPKKPSFGLSQQVGDFATPIYGPRSLTKKKFLSLFKPVMAIASIFKKPIIFKPVTNEVVAMKPQQSFIGNYRPQLDQKPDKPTKPSNQGQKPYSKPYGNLPFRPVYLRPQYGNLGMQPQSSFGTTFEHFEPFRPPYWSHGYHDFPMRYQAKATDDDAEPETAPPFYMIYDEDESQRQEYPVLIPAELMDEITFAEDGDDVTFESRIIDERTKVTEIVDPKTESSVEKKET